MYSQRTQYAGSAATSSRSETVQTLFARNRCVRGLRREDEMDAAQYIAEQVQVAARSIYYGINPEVGSYADEVGKSTLHLRECNPESNLGPWPMYKLVKAAVRTEERGTAYFLTIQVPKAGSVSPSSIAWIHPTRFSLAPLTSARMRMHCSPSL